MAVRVMTGDCREVLATLPDQSVHCCVTSPPYFGLRDYGMPEQIGMELTPTAFVAQLVAVFAEVRRALRDDGTLWLNLGDSYAGRGRTGGMEHLQRDQSAIGARGWVPPAPGFKDKDLYGIPWRVAIALQADGWYLRSDIIWHKPNPMPESVTDRPTKAHEYLFLLAKSERYYYNADAIKEAAIAADPGEMDGGAQRLPNGSNANEGRNFRPGRSGNSERKSAMARGCPAEGVKGSVPWKGFTRNRRTVWSVPTSPYSGAHFATFPPALIEPCILAGCPDGGTVLDPFGGAGTTGLVADRLGRNAVLIELNPAYADMARDRIKGDAPMFADVV